MILSLIFIASVAALCVTLFQAGLAAQSAAAEAARATEEARNVSAAQYLESVIKALEPTAEDIARRQEMVSEYYRIATTAASDPRYSEAVRTLQTMNVPGPWNIQGSTEKASGKSATYGEVLTGMQGGAPGTGPGTAEYTEQIVKAPEMQIGTASKYDVVQKPQDVGSGILSSVSSAAQSAMSSFVSGVSSVIPSVSALPQQPTTQPAQEKGGLDYSLSVISPQTGGTVPLGTKEGAQIAGQTIASAQAREQSALASSGAVPSLVQLADMYAQGRPGYTAISDLGDTKTTARAYELMYTVPGLTFEGAKMTALEEQRASVASKGQYRETQYFTNELEKAGQNFYERGSALHYLGKAADVPIPANPYEYSADLAVEFLKGAPISERYMVSPVSGEMAMFLPSTGGLQEFSWDIAKQYEKTGTANIPKVSYTPAIEKLLSAQSEYGPYGSLYGGPSYIGTPSSEGLRKQADFVWTPELASSIVQTAALQGISPSKAAKEAYGFGVSTQPEEIIHKSEMTYEIVTPEIKVSGVGPTIVQKAQKGAGGLDYGKTGGYVASDTTLLPQKTTIDVGTIPILGMFAAPVAGLFGIKEIEAGALGAFVNPPMKETTRAGTPVAIPEVTVPGETTVRATPTGYEIVSTETKYGGFVTPYVTKQEVAGKSGYEQFKQNIRDVLKLPTPEAGEKVVQLTALTMPVIGTLTLPSVIAEVKGDKEAARYTGIIEPLKGQYTQFYEEPLMTPISFGVGAALGGIVGAGAKYYPEIKAAAGGGKVVGAMDTFITNIAPKVLGGLYAADIAGRSIGYSTEGIRPEAVSKARGIVMQEAVPMGVGFTSVGKISEVAKATTTVIKALPETVGTIRESIPSVSDLKYKYIEWKTPETAMGTPMASERFATEGRYTKPGSTFSGVAQRVNPFVEENVARMEFYMGRLRSRPSSQLSPTDPMHKIMGEEPKEVGRISITGLGGEKGVTGFVVGQSPFTIFSDVFAKGKVSATELIAKYKPPVQKAEPYKGIETKTPSGVVVSKAEVSAKEQAVVETTTTPSLGLRTRGRYVIEEEPQYYRTPKGMERPAPKESTQALRRMQPEVQILGSEVKAPISLGLLSTQGISSVLVPSSVSAKEVGFDLVSRTALQQVQLERTLQESRIKQAMAQGQKTEMRKASELKEATKTEQRRMQRPAYAIETLITPKETTKISTVVTPTRTTPPRETTITTPRITPIPTITRTPFKVPSALPSPFAGGGGAGARAGRGRRFTKVLQVGTGIGWIDIAGKQRRPSRRK